MEKLTINNQEINFAQLIKQDNVQLRVPHYQRNYKWTKKQVEDLVADLNGLVDGGHEKIPIHFMGSIIGHQINNGFNQIEPLLIIDGIHLLAGCLPFDAIYLQHYIPCRRQSCIARMLL